MRERDKDDKENNTDKDKKKGLETKMHVNKKQTRKVGIVPRH